MSDRCAQEMCGNWSGDGRVCPCALLDLEGDERPIQKDWSCPHDPTGTSPYACACEDG